MNDASRPPRSQVVIVIAAITLALAMLLGIVAVCGLLRSPHPGLHSPRLSLTNDQLTVSVDQPYADTGSSKACRKAFGDAVLLPSPATALAGLGVVAAAGVITRRLARRLETFGRDPPRGPATFLTGQGLLTRLCLARR